MENDKLKAEQIKLEESYSVKRALRNLFEKLNIEHTSEKLDDQLRTQPCWYELLNLGYECRDAMLLKIVVSTSTTSSIVLSSLVGTLQYVIKDYQQEYSMDECAEIALDYIIALSKIGFIAIARLSDIQIIVYPMSVELNQAQIADLKAKSKFLPPMVAEPKKITQKLKSPFYTSYPYQLVKHTRSRKSTPRNVLNILNKLKFTLTTIAEQPSPIPAKDITCLGKVDIATLTKFTSNIGKVHKYYKGRKFHFAHSFDSRLRIYPLGYHVNYQGFEYQKASLDLAKKYTIVVPK